RALQGGGRRLRHRAGRSVLQRQPSRGHGGGGRRAQGRRVSLDPLLLAAIAGTFVLAGLVKGVIGFGLPTVAVALLTLTIGLKDAMALMLVPSLVTNLWQALAGGRLWTILRRFWALFLT